MSFVQYYLYIWAGENSDIDMNIEIVQRKTFESTQIAANAFILNLYYRDGGDQAFTNHRGGCKVFEPNSSHVPLWMKPELLHHVCIFIIMMMVSSISLPIKKHFKERGLNRSTCFFLKFIKDKEN